MQMRVRSIAVGLLASLVTTTFAPGIALAGEREAKNVAIAATAASVYLLSQKKTRNTGYVAAAGSAYLWKKYADSRKARNKREEARNRYYRLQAQRNAREAAYYKNRYVSSQKKKAKKVKYNRSYARR